MFKSLFSAASAAIDKLQATFPPNRIVVILTPLLFVPAAGFVTAYVAQKFPGLPTFSTGEVVGIFAGGGLIAARAANKWLDGWQKHEAAQLSKP